MLYGNLRSFIMCDDPRRVVESGAIRKQKIRSNSNDNRHGRGNGKEERRHCEQFTERPKKTSDEEIEFETPFPLQLLKISKGIQKLNEAIESWSNGLSFQVRPNDVAKDLLRGALDLEESLAALGRIQEASSMNTKNSSYGKEGKGDVKFQRSMSDRFVERYREKRMIPQEESSIDCYQELGKVIRESFVRQNLLSAASGGKNQSCGSVSMSSTRSSTINGNDSSSTKSSVSMDVLPMKRRNTKGSNLIARLMGLDEFPIKNAERTPDYIDKPEIMRSNSVKNIILPSSSPHAPNHCCAEKMEKKKKKEKEKNHINSSSPIVLMKSMCVSEIEGRVKRKVPVVPRKPRMQGEIHPRMMMIHQTKGRSANSGITSDKIKLPLRKEIKGDLKKKKVDKAEEKNTTKNKKTTSSNIRSSNSAMRDSKPVITKQKAVKKELSEGKDRSRSYRRPTEASKKTITTKDQKQAGAKKSDHPNKRLINAKNKSCQQDNSENTSVSSRDTIGSADQVSAAAEESISSEFHARGHCEEQEVSSCNDIEISVKTFLSTSWAFLRHAMHVFDLNTNITSISTSTCNNNIMVSDQRLTLDCAKEVATVNSLKLWRSASSSSTCPRIRQGISMDELLMEVCDELEALRSYRNMFSGQDYVSDSVHMMLEKDLKSETASGAWDLDWRTGFRIDHTHQVVIDLEKLILIGLIEEIMLS